MTDTRWLYWSVSQLVQVCQPASPPFCAARPLTATLSCVRSNVMALGAY
jgi:hypothetical protein